MRKVTIRQFHQNMWGELKDLPVIVTRRGEPSFLVDVVPTGTEPTKVEFKAESDFQCNVGFCVRPAIEQRKDGKWVCEEHK